MSRIPLAARAGRWSASHRRAAVIGWLAFVLIAYAVGALVGTVTLRDQDFGNGESLAANRVLAQEFPRERAAEQVLIQSRRGRLAARDLRGAATDLVARLSRLPAVARLESPLAPGNAGLRSHDGTAALVTFQISGDPDTAKDRVGPMLAAVAAAQRAHPGLFVGEFGDGSSNKAILDRVQTDFRRAEVTSLP